MEIADPAGTLQFGTSPTLDTEYEGEEGVQYGLCFLVGYGEDGIYLDSCVDVSGIIGKSWAGVMAAEKLTGIENREARAVVAAVSTLSIRGRFINASNPGPYLVKTSFPLSSDDLKRYLRSLDKTELKSFLERSKL